MPNLGKSARAPLSCALRTRTPLCCLALVIAMPAFGQSITALPDQTSTIRLSNRDVNHLVCVGGEIEDVKFSAEKAISVEKGGSDASIIRMRSSFSSPTPTMSGSIAIRYSTCMHYWRTIC